MNDRTRTLRWRRSNLASLRKSLGAPLDADIVALWNERVPPGSLVRYWPVALEGTSQVSRTRSEAWSLGHGAPIVKIEGIVGGVSIDHLRLEETPNPQRKTDAENPADVLFHDPER